MATRQFKSKPVYRKLVVVGDGACGKTSLLNVYVNGMFPSVYEPTVFENHTKDINLEDQIIEMSLWDTAGQEEFDRLRSLSYADTHVILICFSVDQPSSLDNVEAKWLEEIHEHCPGVKLCLVALKCDLREDAATRERLSRHGEAPVQYEEGLAVARRIRASRYLECSAKHGRGVNEVFIEAARISVKAPTKGQTRTSADGDSHGGSRLFGCFRW
ncbi:GTP-binding protein Rho3 [Cystobasidium minutum MCA 4210]|uniref:GTP-binding protein Rho3 n=1 Tax=Cystobasidium minutum MCA 4210 TaxID=1397322 RepID=UPI0034CEE9A8|eukprot:jgi/Rhomi1/173904/fgenesh1_kg.6_\